MDETLKTKLEQIFDFSLNRNQYNDLRRLFFEIKRRDNLDSDKVINKFKNSYLIRKAGGRNKFSIIKENLIKLRFPLTSQKEKIDTKKVFLPDLKSPLGQNLNLKPDFYPEKIFIEKSAKHSYLATRFTKEFPQVPTAQLDYYSEYLKTHRFSVSQLKKPFVFIVKEKWDFIKPCPCTKGHLGCNYWIFNLGFGCPYDCSYCFLQQYSNFPGIVLPANLDDFFLRFDDFYKKIKRPIRIGTGEFCDSLALDNITGYSSQLVNFFRDKPVYFELKTKSTNINNLLKIKPGPNIIIAWSLNPQSTISSEEMGTASLDERLNAAKKVQDKGYTLGFHFDPVIYSDNWQALYKQVIDKLYHELKPPFKWISLGTLRGTRGLKNIAEIRFPHSNIFYGELFLGEDKKLRYPQFLREEIYKTMVNWIRNYDKKTPLYLCMEDRNTWGVINKEFDSVNKIEQSLLGR